MLVQLVSETFQPERKGAKDKIVSIAQFETLSELLLLDLTDLPRTPGISGSESREFRHGITFLRRFNEDFVKPVARDGNEHTEYVPTQIVTEYFRHRFLADKNRRLDGILYRSSLLHFLFRYMIPQPSIGILLYCQQAGLMPFLNSGRGMERGSRPCH